MVKTSLFEQYPLYQSFPPSTTNDIMERCIFSPLYLSLGVLHRIFEEVTVEAFRHVNLIFFITENEIDKLPPFLDEAKDVLLHTESLAVFNETTRDIILLLDRHKTTEQVLISFFHELRHSFQFGDSMLSSFCLDTLEYTAGLSDESTSFEILEYDAEGFGLSTVERLQHKINLKNLIFWDKIRQC